MRLVSYEELYHLTDLLLLADVGPSSARRRISAVRLFVCCHAGRRHRCIRRSIHQLFQFVELIHELRPNDNHSNHRLNGSSSHVLTATSLSYGEAKNSTPHRINTPDPTEIKFGTVDYVG